MYTSLTSTLPNSFLMIWNANSPHLIPVKSQQAHSNIQWKAFPKEKRRFTHYISVMVRRSTNTFCILKHPSAVLCCRHYPYITLCSFAKMSQSADKYALIWMRFDRFCMLCHHASHVSTPSFSVFLVFLFFFFFLSSLCHVQEHFQRGSQVLHLFSLSKNSI